MAQMTQIGGFGALGASCVDLENKAPSRNPTPDEESWTDERDVSMYVKRTLILSAWLGNAAANRRRYARLNPVAAAAKA